MFAVFEAKGFQWFAKPGEHIKMPRIDKEVGEEIKFDKVLLVKDDEVVIGQPYLDNISVVGEVIEQGKHDKIYVFKFKRRNRYRKTKGHRQPYTEIKINKIEAVKGKKKKKAEKAKVKKKEVEKKKVEVPEIKLEELPGIGPARAEKLRDAGVANVKEFLEADDEHLVEILGNLDIDGMKEEGAMLLNNKKGGEDGS